MRKRVCIVHYNTPEITAAVVKSVWKHTPDCEVTVFDNSDKYPFVPMEGVEVIDNTKGQICDFDKWIASYPMARPTVCNNGSEKHMWSVEYLYQHSDEGFVLVDSDALVKADLTPLFDESVAWIGQPEDRPMNWHHVRRLQPYCLWINVPMCKKAGITFMSEGRIFMVSHSGPPWYDTGASFYHDCVKANLPSREIETAQYVEHLVGGSQNDRLKKAWRSWLSKYRYLYEDTDQKMERKKKREALKEGEQILVVIPYCSEGAQGRELEYAVEGWRRHFQENYLIVLAGEDHPITKTGDDIICIESERVPPKEGQYRQHLDYVSCLRKVRKAFPDSKGFIMVADDCYAVNDFDLTDVKALKQKASDITASSMSPNGWQRDKAKTRDLLVKLGYPTRNFTTHLPQWYDWDKLEALWDRFDMDNESYVMEDLYFNIYYPTRVPLQLHIDFDNYKCGVYRPNPRMHYIQKAFRAKIWIQNSVDGWIPALDKALADYYGI